MMVMVMLMREGGEKKSRTQDRNCGSADAIASRAFREI